MKHRIFKSFSKIIRKAFLALGCSHERTISKYLSIGIPSSSSDKRPYCLLNSHSSFRLKQSFQIQVPTQSLSKKNYLLLKKRTFVNILVLIFTRRNAYGNYCERLKECLFFGDISKYSSLFNF